MLVVVKINRLNCFVGFGIMGYYGYIVENYIMYGSDENIDLIDVFFNIVNYYLLVYFMEKVKEIGEKFYCFEKFKYVDGFYFDGCG